MSDPYIDPQSGVLKNRLGIRDQYELDEVEREAATAAADVIQDGYGPERTFDREHLKALHRQMFSRVYEWAGSMRDENPVMEGEAVDRIELLSKGASIFIPGSMIGRGIAVATSHIADLDALRNGTREAFAEKSGNTLGELNHVHPFREGNGRTQRAFIEDLGRETGHEVDFGGITRERMLQASITVNNDPHADDMRHVMRDATDPERVAVLRETRERLERSGLDSDEYRIATPRDGERVEGELTYRDERVAHIESGKDLIVVNARDVAGRESADRQVSFTASPFDPGRAIEGPPVDDPPREEPSVKPDARSVTPRDLEMTPPPGKRHVLTLDQEMEARALAQRIDEARVKDPAAYENLLSGAVRGNRDVANTVSQFVSADAREDMIRHVQEQTDRSAREAPASPVREAEGRAMDDQDRDFEDALDDRAEELHRKTVAAMRDGLAEIDDPARVAAAQKVIDRLEEAGRQFRADRENDDRDLADDPRPEIERTRDADIDRQTRAASARAMTERDAASMQTAERAVRDDASRQAARQAERDRDEEDELER